MANQRNMSARLAGTWTLGAICCLCLLMGPWAAAQTGSITGNVGSGSGHSINKADVEAFDEAGAPLAATQTDTNGNYTLTGVPEGAVKVRFSHHSYGTLWYDAATNFGAAAPVAVTSGGTTPNIDAVLPQRARLSGTVVDEVTVAPIAGVNVSVYDESGFLIDSTTTDAVGFYLLGMMPSGNVKVYFEADVLGYLPEWYDDKSSFDEGDLVAVDSGSLTAGIHAALTPCLFISAQPQGVAITAGEMATLWVTADSPLEISYQWYVGISGDMSNPVEGAQSGSYTTPTLTETTDYWVQVITTCRTLDSDTATVTVTTACEAPATPDLAPSAVGAPGTDYNVSWTDTCPDGSYELIEADNPHFENAATATVVGASQLENHSPILPTYYYYRVRAVRICSEQTYLSDWSVIRHAAVTGLATEPADIDEDGSVTSVDLLLLADYLAGNNASGGLADINVDTLVDAIDLDYMMHFLAGTF
jgi:hypothetical protein